MSTPFIAFQRPPGASIAKYDRSKPSQEQDASVPQYFKDCMEVREEVFVREQKVPIENEFDEDDARSFHWVVFASVSTGSQKGGRKNSQTSQVPVATVRLVPPPHPPHPAPGSEHKIDNNEPSNSSQTLTHPNGNEPYIKLGRLATLPAYRGLGLGRLLMNTVLEWAANNRNIIQPLLPPMTREAQLIGRGLSEPLQRWRGLVLVHAQLDVEKMYLKWGFVTDKEMGVWDEEGIQHVGMWKRLQVLGI
ncbi:hypothetical protein FGG08_003599 [Glutinoglossum americanum]|uniref:Glucosamine 6-phosphate N-acetyltransferase n=1 Tax=Glutinoglossum americanum TaxID=1670608 RepID=A0A9P8I9B4_9PEZI|nr:hypothetical protein FGG08_003599 [Glutinoglossum americanum]